VSLMSLLEPFIKLQLYQRKDETIWDRVFIEDAVL
jgi:hypothetical protein